MLNLSLEILKKDTSFPGTERDGVVASGGVGMTLVSKIVCHWQRQKKNNNKNKCCPRGRGGGVFFEKLI